MNPFTQFLRATRSVPGVVDTRTSGAGGPSSEPRRPGWKLADMTAGTANRPGSRN